MSPDAVSRRLRRLAGLFVLDQKLFKTARFVKPRTRRPAAAQGKAAAVKEKGTQYRKARRKAGS